MTTRWRIWMRPGPGEGWMEPVIAGPGTEVGWESEEDAEMIAESFRHPSVDAEVRVLPEGQHPNGTM